jgi:DNA-binding SARP family transcriptional activator
MRSTDAHVTVRLLGAPTVRGRDGQTTPPDGAQARVVLAALALAHPNPIDVEDLAQIVWGDELPETWRPALRGLVSRVRATLASEPLGTGVTLGPAGYRMVAGGRLQVDVHLAARATVLAEIATEDGEVDQAVTHAAVVTDLTERPFIPSGDGAWVRARRVEVELLRVRVLHVLARAHLARQHPDRAVRAAQEALELRPTQESSHRLLMECLAEAGETGEAARAYDRCRTMLVDELGIGPARQTTDLLEQILRSTD